MRAKGRERRRRRRRERGRERRVVKTHQTWLESERERERVMRRGGARQAN